MDSRAKAGRTSIIPKLDSEKGELRTPEGEDWVLISGEALRRVYQYEVTVLGTGACVIWYNAGKAVGRTEGKRFVEMAESVSIDQLAEEVGRSYSQLGWGRIDVREVDLMKNEITITMRNSPMARGVLDNQPRCWYVRGFMEGIVSSVLGVEATAFEVACEAVNGEHCEFKATWNVPTVADGRAGT